MQSELTTAKVAHVMNLARQREALKAELLNLMLAVLRSHDGKLINKRLTTAMQESLPQYSFAIEGNKVMGWGGARDREVKWNDMVDFRIVGDNLNGKRVDYAATVAALGPRRESSREMLDSLSTALKNLPKLVGDYNQALGAMAKANEAFGRAGYCLSDSHRVRADDLR